MPFKYFGPGPFQYFQQILGQSVHDPPQYFIPSYAPVTTFSKLLDFKNGHRPEATVALIWKIGVFKKTHSISVLVRSHRFSIKDFL